MRLTTFFENEGGPIEHPLGEYEWHAQMKRALPTTCTVHSLSERAAAPGRRQLRHPPRHLCYLWPVYQASTE